jgi:hypothetical protein
MLKVTEIPFLFLLFFDRKTMDFFHLGGTISFCSLKKLFDLFLFVLPRQISKIKIIILNDVLKKKYNNLHFSFFPFYLAIFLS